MGREQNLKVFNEWIAAHQAHDLDKLLALVSDDVTIKSAAGGAMPPAKGKEEARVHWQTIYNTFPDMRMEAVDVTGEGDRIVAEIEHGGTMQGNMAGREPTGKSYRVQGAFRMDFFEGKIRSILSYWDTGSMARQLGLIPGG